MIGIAGLARSGKDTLAKHLSDIISEDFKCEVKRFSFADKIKSQMKDVIEKHYGIDPYTEDTKEKEIIRDILVCHGETMKKIHGKKIWANLVLSDMEECIPTRLGPDYVEPFFIITDVRFDFEAEFIQEDKGSVIHISKVGNESPNDVEAKNDPLVRAAANFTHTWPEYEPDNMSDCRGHAEILWQMLKEENKDWEKWHKRG
tara:strand:+ start:666 stop:1271 length:606 start_codon:yes stop_codon:yes gene_type:complete